MRKSRQPRFCVECGKPSTGRRCMSCYKKGRHNTLAAMYSLKRRKENVKNEEDSQR